MRRTLVLVALTALAVAPVRTAAAQAIPNITAAKSAATNAANAANAHTAAMTGTEAKAPARPAPAKPTPAQAKPAGTTKPTAQPATKPTTKPAEKPAAAPAARPGASNATKPAATTAKTATTSAASAKAPAVAKPDAKGDVKPVPAGEQGAATNVAKRGAASELTFQREVYTYPGHGRRDPFLSLLKSGDLRPLLTDLKLVTVLYDPTGRNSVAIMRDVTTKDQYRVKLGQQLGRMRVAQIQPKQVVFTIEEFGYSRQETLALTSDSTRTR